MKAKPRTLGVIPARGGSKRLPRKNARPLAGHPLIAYTIQAARGAAALTDFLVTSEDEEIIALARAYGAPTPFVRPAHLAGDEVRNIQTVGHALEFMEAATNAPYDMVVLLQPTCPVRDPGHIDQAVELLWASELDTLASVKGPYKKRDPILKAIRDHQLVPFCGEPDLSASEAFYLYNASLYAAKRDYFVQNHRLVSSRQVPLIMDAFHSIDIDTEQDFILAEAIVKMLDRLPPTREG